MFKTLDGLTGKHETGFPSIGFGLERQMMLLEKFILRHVHSLRFLVFPELIDIHQKQILAGFLQ